MESNMVKPYPGIRLKFTSPLFGKLQYAKAYRDSMGLWYVIWEFNGKECNHGSADIDDEHINPRLWEVVNNQLSFNFGE